MKHDKDDKQLKLDAHELLFGVRRSVRYHSRRVQALDNIDKVIKVLTAVSGVGTVMAVVSDLLGPYFVAGFAAAVALLSTIDLIIGFSGLTRLHNDLARQWIDLDREMVLAENDITAAALAGFVNKRLAIEKDEPPILRVQDVICHNELMRAMGYDENELAHVGWFQRLMAPFVDVCAYKLKA